VIEAYAAALTTTAWRRIAEELGRTASAFASPLVGGFDQRRRVQRPPKTRLV